MGNPVRSSLRLIATGWLLVRYDALVPRELDPLLPAHARFAARFLRLFAGPQAKQGRPGERLAHAFERLGPVAIKLGQLLSTRADMFGARFADDLARLKDRLPPFPTKVAHAQIETSLERPVESVFAEFGEPVAAASIAQAHRARTRDGHQVAVKVLRPGIERQVAKDVDAMRMAAGVVEFLARPARRLEPRAVVETVAHALGLEMDLRLEAAAASELGEIMARDGYMRAPAVHWEGVGRRVMTLEWAQGMPMSDPAALEQPGLDRKTLADNIMRGFLAQALDHGAFHADLHEGNLFCAAPAQVIAVDFGIVGRIGPPERRYLAGILWGFLQRDYKRVAEVHFEAGYVPAHHSVEVFAQALRAVGEPVFGRSAREVSMGRLLSQLFEITAQFDMRLRPELVLLQKTMVTVEGVARRVDPDHDLWAAARPVVERWITRELSPISQAKTLFHDLNLAVRALTRLAHGPVMPPVQVDVRRWPAPPARVALAFAAVAMAVATFVLGWILHG
ncbi:2-polyprenylphenol 6-hydroxylase [Caulobacter sp. 17J65-9]|uniref:2-polyprenylphenol 6-hydroxylase n=1 Tax=Caulobacter sp. 17J65-9 TaxID=2709382 RepID=UPI0013C77D37|nr:2-polyprenylphenol 6-hydroxylase [Caulobacter sp. 17J65-9]NEX91742.1 2-polyprenylphenol 6-hydroxylase [Caulobacter sp. 17J65-9]